MNLTGASTIAGTTISGFNVANRSGLVVNSNTGPATSLTVTGSTFQNSTGNTGATSLVNGTGNMTLTIGGAPSVANNCTFTNISASAIVPRAGGDRDTELDHPELDVPELADQRQDQRHRRHQRDGHRQLHHHQQHLHQRLQTASTGEALISFVGLNSGGTNTFA